jgi:hypothetical protein
MSEDPTSEQTTAGTADRTENVTLRFRRDQMSSGVSRRGQLRPAGQLTIDYDIARLTPEGELSEGPVEVVCHVLFQPGAVETVAKLQPPVALQSTAQQRRLATFGVEIPLETTVLEIWFERVGPTGTTAWDSRYGRNFRFPVTPGGLSVPEASVVLRPDARVDPARIHVIDDAASKGQTSIGAGGSRLQTDLVVRARLDTIDRSAAAWADVHVFDAAGELISVDTIGLQESAEPTDDTVRVWDGDVYQGSGGGSGMGVWSRPDAHTVQYRLYSEVDGNLYTDGVLHEFDVPADAEVWPARGGF